MCAMSGPRGEPLSRDAGARDLRAHLDAAARALPADPDLAALLLDGAFARLLAACAPQAAPGPVSMARALSGLEQSAPPLAMRLRLALRAPNAEARLAHARALLALWDAPERANPQSDQRNNNHRLEHFHHEGESHA